MQEAKVYVGNLDYGVKEEDLKKLFEENGIAVEKVTLISDKYTGRSKGFGFIAVRNKGAIQEAIDKLNNKEFNGRNLNVSKAREKRQRKDFSPRGYRSGKFHRY